MYTGATQREQPEHLLTLSIPFSNYLPDSSKLKMLLVMTNLYGLPTVPAEAWFVMYCELFF
jgi:hypothetical protein